MRTTTSITSIPETNVSYLDQLRFILFHIHQQAKVSFLPAATSRLDVSWPFFFIQRTHIYYIYISSVYFSLLETYIKRSCLHVVPGNEMDFRDERLFIVIMSGYLKVDFPAIFRSCNFFSFISTWKWNYLDSISSLAESKVLEKIKNKVSPRVKLFLRKNVWSVFLFENCLNNWKFHGMFQ